MFNPVPPRDESKVPPPQDLEAVHTPAWRPRAGRWPALLRLSWLCRLLALLTVLFGLIWAVLALTLSVTARNPDQFFLGLLGAVSIFIASVVAFFIWMGLAEAILVFLAIERNTRQTRDRLQKNQGDGSLFGDKDFSID